MSNRNQSGSPVRLKPSDLRIRHQCTKCDRWHTAHAIPWGEPLALLVTGYCPHCGASYLSLRQASEEGIGGAACDLARHFLQIAPGAEQPDMTTRH